VVGFGTVAVELQGNVERRESLQVKLEEFALIALSARMHRRPSVGCDSLCSKLAIARSSSQMREDLTGGLCFLPSSQL
jgi:hypothetical protein